MTFVKRYGNAENLETLKIKFDGAKGGTVSLNFESLPNLNSLILSEMYSRPEFPHLLKISSLTGLENFPSLASLDVSNTSLTSVPNVEGLNNLKTVSIYNSKVDDITSLKSLTNLETLNLSNNQISNLYALKNLTKLTTLNLSNNIFSDTSSDDEGKSFNNLSLLAELNKNGALKNLDLSGCGNVTNFGPLQASDLTWATRTGF